VDLTEARDVLGVTRDSSWPVVRERYRTLMLANHPDHAGSPSTAAAARITQAYALVRARYGDPDAPDLGGDTPPPTRSQGAARTRPPAAEREPAPDWGRWAKLPAGSVRQVDADTLGIDASREDAMLALLEVGYDIGEVSFVDVDLGLLEVIVQFVGAATCSLVISLQGRADRVDAFCSVESYDGKPPPPIAQVTRFLAHELSAAD
jgi:hypothetical protein